MIRFFFFGVAIAAATASFILYFQVMLVPTSPTEIALSAQTVENQLAEAQVLVARKDLPEHHRIEIEDFGWVAWPEKHLLSYFSVKPEASNDLSSFEGLYTARPYSAGEPVDVRMLKTQRVERLSDRVTQGMRAVSISVSAMTTAGGFVKVEDYVDIIRVSGSSDQAVGSSVILENIKVLAVGSSMEASNGSSKVADANPGTVTVELSPQQATVLAAADFEGRLALALRTRSDHSPVETEAPLANAEAQAPTNSVEPPPEVPEPRHSIGVLQGETWVPYAVP